MKEYGHIMWFTGRPKEDGEYVVVTQTRSVQTYHYTVKYGWNTHSFSYDSAIEDEYIVAWTGNFAPAVIDIYGNRDIIE